MGSEGRRWVSLAVCLTASFMSLLDANIVNVALPSIETGLGATQAHLQWIVAGYSLALGLVLIPSGRIGDIYGRRTMFIVGVGIFTAGSILAGFATSAGALVLARLFQGVGGGVLNPQVSGIIQDLFRGRARGRAFGLLGTVIAVSSAIGPLVGGLILQAAPGPQGWRWVFFVNAPIGITAMLLAIRLLPEGRRRRNADRGQDPWGILLLGLATLAMLFPLVQLRQLATPVLTLLFVLGAMFAAAFLLWEQRLARRGGPVLLDLALFRLPGYGVGVLLAFLFFVGSTGFIFTLTLYLQNGLGHSPLVAGVILSPLAIGAAVASPIGGTAVHRFGNRVVLTGFAAILLGLAGIASLLTADITAAGEWRLALFLLIVGVGNGLVVSPNQVQTLSNVPGWRAGIGGAVITTGQRVGAALGVAITGSVYFTMLSTGAGQGRAVLVGMSTTLIAASLALTIGTITARRRP
ncbi:MFS transporter [Georgenia sp. H159]|uniref:MFS transporter n=1 Tax=Georgenia sp. H159 TaxID=3076115 RepID=UPI002D770654|nr:MFS transporter [Georgenia sp. H159]